MKDTHSKVYPRWAFPFDFSPSQPMIAEGLRAAYNQMLFLIQEKVIKQKAISSLEPPPQSSARVTQPHRRAPTSDDLGQAKFGPFSGSPIIVLERPPVITVPALHFPAESTHCNIRHVKLCAYERDESDAVEMAMNYQKLDGRKVLLAFQLITKLESLSVSSGIDEYQQSFWNAGYISADREAEFMYKMYYRSAEEKLDPNPCFASIWTKLCVEE